MLEYAEMCLTVIYGWLVVALVTSKEKRKVRKTVNSIFAPQTYYLTQWSNSSFWDDSFLVARTTSLSDSSSRRILLTCLHYTAAPLRTQVFSTISKSKWNLAGPNKLLLQVLVAYTLRACRVDDRLSCENSYRFIGIVLWYKKLLNQKLLTVF